MCFDIDLIEKNDYQLERVIGQGATAMVMAATFTHPETKQPSDCAIKLINLDRRSENMNDIAKVNNAPSWNQRFT